MKRIALVLLLLMLLNPLGLFSVSLFSVVGMGSAERILEVIESGADVNERTADGWTPLMFATSMNRDPAASLLMILSGAELDARDSDGLSPLMYAAWSNGNPDVLSVLIMMGAEIDARDIDGWTPLCSQHATTRMSMYLHC